MDDAGLTACFACCADKDRAGMREDGRATLYLTKDKDSGAWSVSNWSGSLRIPIMGSPSHKPRAGGFGAQRTDVGFVFEGFIWHAINRGDMDIARCKRTKNRFPHA
jgi:hypothetical protein